jgi:hypothetical protein
VDHGVDTPAFSPAFAVPLFAALLPGEAAGRPGESAVLGLIPLSSGILLVVKLGVALRRFAVRGDLRAGNLSARGGRRGVPG